MLPSFKTIRMAMAALLVLATFAAPALAANKEVAGDTVATVNGIKVSRQDFDREMRSAQQYFASQGQAAPAGGQNDEMKKAVLDKLVNGVLLYQASKKGAVKVDQAAIDAEVSGFKKRFPSVKEYQEGLKQLHLTEKEIREKIEQNMAIQKFIERDFVNKATVPEQEIKDYYENNTKSFQEPEQVRASHILITVKPEAAAATKKAARKKLEDIRKKIVAGGDFAALAKTSSDCPSSKQGGDLGYFSRGQMVKPFEAAAFSMMPGDISQVVETQFGYHLIKLMEKKNASVISFADAHDRIAGFLKQAKAQKKLGEYVEGLRKGAKITTAIPAK